MTLNTVNFILWTKGGLQGIGEAGKARLKSTQRSVEDRFRVRLFNGSLWKIESYYGAVVVSFFKFLKVFS